MIKNKCLAAVLTMCLLPSLVSAQEEPKIPSPEEMAAKETERLEELLSLEDWQVFYIDSTLVFNYSSMMAEAEELQRSRVENADLYVMVQDKWMERTEEAYRKFFTDAQWEKYLKHGGKKMIDARQKRRMKAAGVKPDRKKKGK